MDAPLKATTCVTDWNPTVIFDRLLLFVSQEKKYRGMVKAYRHNYARGFPLDIHTVVFYSSAFVR